MYLHGGRKLKYKLSLPCQPCHWHIDSQVMKFAKFRHTGLSFDIMDLFLDKMFTKYSKFSEK